MNPAIRVSSLGKRYRLGLTHARSLNEIAARCTARLRGRPVDQPPEQENTRTTGGDFWALQDINFEVAQGEVVGIIGRNGAGKSTLLKILSRVTRPTTGQVDLRGRVGSLLEVGTGFHPELTGRENVFMNGTLLGMTKREVARRFDEILDFAGVEKFIDTPVKRYSSGMKVRLGFAVAAHLEPEILIVDEVLAVGDAAFQRKCLGKMSDIAEHGRTILFVSHNMAAVQRLTTTAVWLEYGQVRDRGQTDDVLENYLAAVDRVECTADLPPDPGKPMRLRHAAVQPIAAGHGRDTRDGLELCLTYDVNRRVEGAHIACRVETTDGVTVFLTTDADLDSSQYDIRRLGSYRARFELPISLLAERRYSVTISMGIPYIEVFDRHEAVVQFENTMHHRNESRLDHRARPGVIDLQLPWNTEPCDVECVSH